MKEYTKGFVRYYHGNWRGTIKWKEDGKCRSKSTALTTYPKTAADGSEIRLDIPLPTEARPNQGKKFAEIALAEWRQQLIDEDAKAEEAAARAAKMMKLGVGANTTGTLNANSSVYECAKAFVASRRVRTENNPGGISPSTLYGYEQNADRLRPYFEDIAIKDITPAHVQALHQDLDRLGRSSSTINKTYFCLKNACEYAVENGLLDTDTFMICFPKKRRDAPKAKAVKPNPLTEDSLNRLNDNLNSIINASNRNRFVAAVELALMTGMRIGEICGLRIMDVDFGGNKQYPNGYLIVRNVVSRLRGGYFEKEPKNGHERVIPLNQDIKELLIDMRSMLECELISEGIDLGRFGGHPDPKYYYLGDINGEYMNPGYLSRRWAALAEGNGYVGILGKRCTFHDLRHTFATRAIHEGVDVEVVSKILGHSDVAMTLNVYADAMPESKVRGMEALAGVLRR